MMSLLLLAWLRFVFLSVPQWLRSVGSPDELLTPMLDSCGHLLTHGAYVLDLLANMH